MGERFCCFLVGVGAPVGECLDRHSPRKEGSRQAERCWGRDLADGLVSRQGMGVRAMGLRGGASKNNTPPHPRLPGTQALLAASAKALPWLPATPPWGQEGLCLVPPTAQLLPSLP